MALRHGSLSGEASSNEAGGARHAHSLTDAELMASVGKGDAFAHAELLHRHWHAVVCYAAALLDHDSAEDVAQETFLRASAHAAQWRPLGPLRAYLLHIARNVVLNERRCDRTRYAALASAHSSITNRTVATPAELLEESELRAAILRALDAMPERRREVFALVRFGGLSYRETAAVMRISAQTAANHMSHAMADIRRAIEPFGEQG